MIKNIVFDFGGVIVTLDHDEATRRFMALGLTDAVRQLELDCSSNQLTGLDVSKNAALTELECSSNQLTSLDVSQNAALTELECNSNQLTGIDVSMNTALKTLSCYSNQLMNLDLSKCTKLSAASVSSQSKSVVASSWGSNQYSIDVPADFNLSKVTSFKVNSVSVTPTLSNGKLLFITSSVPTSVSYEYNTDNSVAGSMSVTVNITAVEDAAPANTVYMDDMEVMTGMEFGGTSGVVTLEDILEEIVGEINDEYDEEEKFYTRVNHNTYIFEGKTLLSDFCKILEVDDEEFSEVEGDADTLAGLLLEIKGDFPQVHEKLHYREYLFEILKLEERRISRVKVVVKEKGEPSQPKKD